MELHADTFFAPSARATPDILLREREHLAQHSQVTLVLEALPTPAAVLNRERQILFANKELLALVESSAAVDSSEEVSPIGQRLGEAIGCGRSSEGPNGCGTGEACRNCGAVIAILGAQEGGKQSHECRVLRTCKMGFQALDLRVTASPLELDGHVFTLLVAEDISNEKRRLALERIFFHDLLNSASGVQGLTTLLHETPPEDTQPILRLLSFSIDQMIDEINAQRTLNAAERNDLQTNPDNVPLLPFVWNIAESFAAHEVARDRYIRIDPQSVPAMVVSDPALLRRVLINLIKNGLESSKRGEAVTVTVAPAEGSARITVHNNAVMSDQTRRQIFNRSFSTRGVGRGLGTYSVKLITERYLGGKVTFTSEEAKGTRFTVSIPCAGDR